MMHAAHTSWTPPAQSPDAVRLSFSPAAATEVAALQPTAISEYSATTAVPSPVHLRADLYSMDTAVNASGLAGLWMMVVGVALLVRHLRVSSTLGHQQ